MKLVGKTMRGGTPFELAAGATRLSRFMFPTCRITKLSIYADGLGSGSGNQVMNGVVYDTGGTLLATGDTVTIADGAPAAWVDLPFSQYMGGIQVAAPQQLDLGVLGGASTNTIRVYGDDPGTGAILSVFATYTALAQATPDETDFYFARMPFDRAQEVLDTGKTEQGSLVLARLSWHGNKLDQERGSFVIVDQDGPLAGLVGERLRIRAGRGEVAARSVVAYCHTMANLVSDLSVPRRLALALGLLGDETPQVEVEVVT